MEKILTFEEYKAISKEIKRLCNNNQHEKALELCTDENCKQDEVIQIQKIDILFKLKRPPKEIIAECEKGYARWKNKGIHYSKLIAISQLIKELVNKEQYEEALKLCTDENCKQHEAIQTQKINILFKLKRPPREIIAECEKGYARWKSKGIHYSKLVAISQLIKELVSKEQYEEALELCTDENCKQNEAIQTQKINILFKLKRPPKEIIIECEKGYARWKSKGIHYSKLVAISQLIKELVSKEQYEEALELCTDENCKQHEAIQGQKINILFKLKRPPKEIIAECEKGYARWKSKGFIIQKLFAISQLIKELVSKEQYEEALKLCTDENCKLNEAIQTQKINILFKLKRPPREIIAECDKGYARWKKEKFIKFKLVVISQLIKELVSKEQYEEALELCTDENCKQYEKIACQRRNIENKIKELKTNLDSSSKVNNSIYLTRIYYDDITISELNELTMNFWEKLILQLAYYEKNNKKIGLQLLKRSVLEQDLTIEEKKILNRIKERLIAKRTTVFICNDYCKILNCCIDFEYVPKIEEEEFYNNEIDSGFDLFLEEVYELARNNKTNELKQLIKQFLEITYNLEFESIVMRLVDFVLEKINIETEEYEQNKKLAILTDTLWEIYLANSQKTKYYLEQKINREYFGKEEKIYKYSKLHQMDIEYNYNIPSIEYFISKLQMNEFEYNLLEETNTLLEDYPYVFAILARECFRMNEVEKGNEFLKYAYEIFAKQEVKDKELQYFMKAIEYHKDTLRFNEKITFSEEMKRILTK